MFRVRPSYSCYVGDRVRTARHSIFLHCPVAQHSKEKPMSIPSRCIQDWSISALNQTTAVCAAAALALGLTCSGSVHAVVNVVTFYGIPFTAVEQMSFN